MATWRYKISPNLALKIFHLFVVLTHFTACELHFWRHLNRNFLSLHSYAQVNGVLKTKAAQTPKKTESSETSDNYHLKVLEAITNGEKQWKK